MKKITLTTIKLGIVALVLVLTVTSHANKDTNRNDGALDLHRGYNSAPVQKYSDWSEPVNLGPTVNAAGFNNVAPAISKDGLSLYFTSNRQDGTGFGGDDIYVSHRDSTDDPWGPPINLGPTINTPLNEREPAFSRDGHLMFFVSNRLGIGGTDIWVSPRTHTDDDFGWQAPENLGAGVNSSLADTGPSYFANEELGTPQLYFSSNRSGGNISRVYVSEQTADGSFGPALVIPELGVTSPGGVTPSIRHDGLEIFLTSNRPGSVGNTADLWVSTRDTVFDAWSEPVNLGPVINSTLVENLPEISSDGKTLFFSSNRTGGIGLVDVWMSTRTKLHGENDE
jgi:WD40-like Beta Propeller Repeat